MVVRVGLIALSILFSAGVGAYHLTGNFWPIYPIIGAISGLLIFFLILYGIKDNHYRIAHYLFLIVIFGIVFRGKLFLLPESLMSIDPQAFAVQTQWIVETGSIDDLSGSFYGTAALFTSANAIAVIITETSPRQAFIITPVAVAIVVPLLTFAIAKRISKTTNTAALVAALLSTVGFASIHYAVAPRPQTITLPFILITIFAVIFYIREPTLWKFLLLMPVGVAMLMTHKLPLVILTTMFALLIMYEVINQYNNYRNNSTQILLYLIVSLMVVQWIFITDFFVDVIVMTNSLLNMLITGETGIGSYTHFSHAEPAEATLIGRAINNSNLLFYLITAVCGAILSYQVIRYKKDNEGLLLVLSATAVMGILTGFGVLFTVFGSRRLLLYGEPFFAIVVAIVLVPLILALHSQNSTTPQKVLGIVIIITISVTIVAQFGAVGITPDKPDSQRMVLSGGEVEAQSWEANYIEDLAYADPYYADFVSNPEHAVAEAKTYEMSTVSQPWHPGVIEDHQFGNATLLEQDYEFYAHRKDIEVYRLGGAYRLTWDIGGSLNNNHSKVYSNNDVEIFHRS